MPKLTFQQVDALARKQGLAPAAAVIATAIAAAESGLNTDAVGDVGIQDSKWGPSVGLWQVRTLKAETGTGGTRDINRLKDPNVNAASMASISSGGKSWGAWSTWTNKSFAPFIGLATVAARSVDADASLVDKLAGQLVNLPGAGTALGVGGSIGSAVGDATSAAGDAIGQAANGVLGPLMGWQGSLQGVLLKTVIVAGAGALFVAGALRLVMPAAVGQVRDAVGA